MGKLKIINGNHRYVASRALASSRIPGCSTLIDSLLKENNYHSNISTLLVDIERDRFLALNNKKTLDDYIREWVNSPNKTYTQGNLTAKFYDLILQFFILHNPNFINEARGRDSNDDRARYNDANAKGLVSFAYYDDDGFLCGVSFSYSKIDPSLWVASIIRHTPADPGNREVMVISSSDLVEDPAEELAENKAAQTFLQFLHSETCAYILKDIISEYGEVDTDELDEVRAYVDSQGTVSGSNELLLEKINRFKQLVEEKNLKIEAAQTIHAQIHHAILNKAAVQEEVKASQTTKPPHTTFFARHWNKIFITLTAIGIGLILSGIFAPLGTGLVIAGLSVKAAVIIGGALCVGSGLTLGVKGRLDQDKRTAYEKMLQAEINEQRRIEHDHLNIKIELNQASLNTELQTIEKNFESDCRAQFLNDDKRRMNELAAQDEATELMPIQLSSSPSDPSHSVRESASTFGFFSSAVEKTTPSPAQHALLIEPSDSESSLVHEELQLEPK